MGDFIKKFHIKILHTDMHTLVYEHICTVGASVSFGHSSSFKKFFKEFNSMLKEKKLFKNLPLQNKRARGFDIGM
jgi:hypothetical protein